MEVAVKAFMAGEVSVLHEGIQNGNLPGLQEEASVTFCD